MNKVSITSIEKLPFKGKVYNLELKGIEKADDLFWIDGKNGVITHNCFPKDVLALKTTAKQFDYNFMLLDSTISANILQKRKLVDKIFNVYGYGGNSLAGKKVALWGLSFKPQTDDIREAPALEIIDNLLRHGAEVSVYDPEAMENVKAKFGDKIDYANSQYDALNDADFLVICTEWNEFRTPDFERMNTLLKSKTIFDGRNLYDLESMAKLKYTYHSIGRKTITN